MALELTGIIPALITPFKADGDGIDEDGLRTLVDFLIGQGVHGLVALGGTGECVALGSDERRQVLEATTEQADGRVPVLAGILTPGLAEAQAQVKSSKLTGVDGLMIVTPYYVSPSQDGLFDAFRSLADLTDLPLVLYNIPYRTGVNILPETVVRLVEAVPHLVGIKECTQDFGQVAELIRLGGDQISVLTGEEYLTLGEWTLGANGAVLASANLIPDLWCNIWQYWQEGNLAAAKRSYLIILPLLRAIFSECNPGPLKAAMNLVGLPAGPVRLPLKQPENETMIHLQKTMTQLQLINEMKVPVDKEMYE